MSIDPLSEKYEWQSVYSFSSNQPIHAPELEGLESAKDLLLKTQNLLDNIKKEVKSWVNENKPILYGELKASGEGNVGIDSKIKGPLEIGVKANYKGQEMGSVKIGSEYDVSKVDVKNTSEVDYKGKNNQVKETSGFGLSLGVGYDFQADKKVDLKTGKVLEETSTKKVSFFGYNYTTTEKNTNGKKTSETSHSYQAGIGAGFFLNIQFGLDIGVKFKGK